MDVFQNETVQFICEVNGPNWTWYHNQNKLDQSNMNYEFVEDEPSLNITEITLNEQGAYACKAGLGGVSSDFSNTVNIIVYGELWSLCECELHQSYINILIRQPEEIVWVS